MANTYIYVFEGAAGSYKIGMSICPEWRRRSIIGAGRRDDEAIHCFQVPTSKAPHIERVVHAALGEFRVKGEWFNAPLPLIQAVIANTVRALVKKGLA